MILLRRVGRGITDHFPIRVTEWVMLFPALGMWAALNLDTAMFLKSPSYVYLAHWADETTWAAVVGIVGIMRLVALTVNGTFKGFAFSPHMRAAASLAGVAIWSQISLGFLMAWWTSGGALSGSIGWGTLVLLEIVNTYRSWSDVGKNLMSGDNGVDRTA